jgi:manganese transport protein
MVSPVWSEVIKGFAPTTDIVRNPDMLYLALGIIGATVMPHNLYLHSGIVQTRAIGGAESEKHEALKFATIDSTVALSLALLVNASILILAAATFHKSGNTDVVEIGQAHAMLAPLVGASVAPLLFAVALVCCGLSSTVTATLAGQIVMEGFLDIKLAPWLRRLITRLIAIIPAAGVTLLYGESGTGKLLIFSQVVLALQLPFAVIPLVMFTRDKSKLGNFTAPVWLSTIAIIIAIILVTLNMKLIFDFITG